MTDVPHPRRDDTKPSGDRHAGRRDHADRHTPLGRSHGGILARTSSRLGTNFSLVLSLVVGLVIALVLSFTAERVYDSITEKDGVSGLDLPILRFAMTLRSPILDSIITGYTNIAGPIGMPILAAAALSILAIHRRSWTPLILVIAAGSGSLLMTIAGKNLTGRARPPLVDAVAPYEYSPSFPSGHTLNAVVIAGVVVYLVILRQHSQRSRVLLTGAAVLFALTIGLSRVFLGHHWFTDVLAGWVLGAAWLALIITAHRFYLAARREHPESTSVSR